MICGAERQRLNHHRWLTAPRRDEAAAIADKEIADVVRAVVSVYHRLTWIVPHAGRAEQVYSTVGGKHRDVPNLRRAGSYHHLVHPILKQLLGAHVVRMIRICETESGTPPTISVSRVQRESVARHR